MENLNVFAVLVAAISSFMLGGLWYSPALFGTVWCREAGVDPKADGRHPAKVFGTAFAFTLVAAALLGWFLGPTPELREALHLSLLIGAGFVATSFGVNYQFAGNSFKLLLIDSGYHILQFVLFGLVLGLWPA